MRKCLAAHFVEIVLAAGSPRNRAFRQILVKLCTRAADVCGRLSYRCHFTSYSSFEIQPWITVARSRNPQCAPAWEGPRPKQPLALIPPVGRVTPARQCYATQRTGDAVPFLRLLLEAPCAAGDAAARPYRL